VICSIPIQTADRGDIFPTSVVNRARKRIGGFQQLVI
jgi:hypothetical protein